MTKTDQREISLSAQTSKHKYELTNTGEQIYMAKSY